MATAFLDILESGAYVWRIKEYKNESERLIEEYKRKKNMKRKLFNCFSVNVEEEKQPQYAVRNYVV